MKVYCILETHNGGTCPIDAFLKKEHAHSVAEILQRYYGEDKEYEVRAFTDGLNE